LVLSHLLDCYCVKFDQMAKAPAIALMTAVSGDKKEHNDLRGGVHVLLLTLAALRQAFREVGIGEGIHASLRHLPELLDPLAAFPGPYHPVAVHRAGLDESGNS
jgi:hypothetical protein